MRRETAPNTPLDDSADFVMFEESAFSVASFGADRPASGSVWTFTGSADPAPTLTVGADNTCPLVGCAGLSASEEVSGVYQGSLPEDGTVKRLDQVLNAGADAVPSGAGTVSVQRFVQVDVETWFGIYFGSVFVSVDVSVPDNQRFPVGYGVFTSEGAAEITTPIANPIVSFVFADIARDDCEAVDMASADLSILFGFPGSVCVSTDTNTESFVGTYTYAGVWNGGAPVYTGSGTNQIVRVNDGDGALNWHVEDDSSTHVMHPAFGVDPSSSGNTWQGGIVAAGDCPPHTTVMTAVSSQSSSEPTPTTTVAPTITTVPTIVLPATSVPSTTTIPTTTHAPTTTHVETTTQNPTTTRVPTTAHVETTTTQIPTATLFPTTTHVLTTPHLETSTTGDVPTTTPVPTTTHIPAPTLVATTTHFGTMTGVPTMTDAPTTTRDQVAAATTSAAFLDTQVATTTTTQQDATAAAGTTTPPLIETQVATTTTWTPMTATPTAVQQGTTTSALVPATVATTAATPPQHLASTLLATTLPFVDTQVATTPPAPPDTASELTSSSLPTPAQTVPEIAAPTGAVGPLKMNISLDLEFSEVGDTIAAEWKQALLDVLGLPSLVTAVAGNRPITISFEIPQLQELDASGVYITFVVALTGSFSDATGFPVLLNSLQVEFRALRGNGGLWRLLSPVVLHLCADLFAVQRRDQSIFAKLTCGRWHQLRISTLPPPLSSVNKSLATNSFRCTIACGTVTKTAESASTRSWGSAMLTAVLSHLFPTTTSIHQVRTQRTLAMRSSRVLRCAGSSVRAEEFHELVVLQAGGIPVPGSARSTGPTEIRHKRGTNASRTAATSHWLSTEVSWKNTQSCTPGFLHTKPAQCRTAGASPTLTKDSSG